MMPQQLPTWWQQLPGATPARLLTLAHALRRIGASKNDRNAVNRIWHEQRIIRALHEIEAERRDKPD